MRGVVNCFMNDYENNFMYFCDETEELFNNKEGCGIEVAIDNDAVEVILDQHEKQLEKIDYRVTKLEDITTKILIQSAEMSVKLSNIESNQVDTKKSILENSITLQNFENAQQNFQKELIDSQKDLVNRLIEKDTKVKISETENKGKVKTQTIITMGAIFTALISGAVTIYTFMHQSSKLVN